MLNFTLARGIETSERCPNAALYRSLLHVYDRRPEVRPVLTPPLRAGIVDRGETMSGFTRRGAVATAGAATLAAGLPRPARAQGPSADVVVIGAGVFGAWTARNLQRLGRRVLLIDAWGPAHARASSGGESRLTRGSYGADQVYTRMALESLAEWRTLSARAELPLFHETGILFFFPRLEDYVTKTIE